MKLIRCDSCKKTYDYDKSEVCPNCGAFNNVQGGHSNRGALEDSYQQERKSQERHQQRNALGEYQAKRQREQAHAAEQDAAKWLESDSREADFQWAGAAPTNHKRSNKMLVIIIIAFIAIGYGVLFLFGFIGMLTHNVMDSFNEWEEDYSEEAADYSEEEAANYSEETMALYDDIVIDNIIVNIEEPFTLQNSGNHQIEDDLQVLAVPYQYRVESDFNRDKVLILENALLVEEDGEIYSYYEALDFALADMVTEQSGLDSYTIDDVFYKAEGDFGQSAITFLLPKENSKPVALQIDVVSLTPAKDEKGESKINREIIKEIIVEF